MNFENPDSRIMETMMKIRVNNLVEVAQLQNPEVLHQLSKLAEVALILQVRTGVRGGALNHRQNHELYPQKEGTLRNRKEVPNLGHQALLQREVVGFLPIRDIQKGVRDFAPTQMTQMVLDLIKVEGVPQLDQEETQLVLT